VEYGVHNGPVTPTTRNVLQNKLSRVMSQRHGLNDGEVRVESQSNGYSESYVVQESTTEYAVRESSTETYAVEEALDTSAAADDFPEADLLHQEVESHLPASKSTTTSYEYRSTPKSTLRYARDSYPSANDLRRRPLNTPVIERSAKSTVEKTHSESVTTALPPKAKVNKSRWYCSVVFLVLLLILVCFVVIVYYHMEHDEMKLMPTAAPTVVPNTEHQKGDDPPKV